MLMHAPLIPVKYCASFAWSPWASVTAAAEALGVSRKPPSAVLNGKADISPEMAIRLAIAFDTSAESWLNQQAQYERWHAERHRNDLKVKRLFTA